MISTTSSYYYKHNVIIINYTDAELLIIMQSIKSYFLELVVPESIGGNSSKLLTSSCVLFLS